MLLEPDFDNSSSLYCPVTNYFFFSAISVNKPMPINPHAFGPSKLRIKIISHQIAFYSYLIIKEQ